MVTVSKGNGERERERDGLWKMWKKYQGLTEIENSFTGWPRRGGEMIVLGNGVIVPSVQKSDASLSK